MSDESKKDQSLRHRETARGLDPAPGYENASAPQPKGPDGQHGDHWVLPKEERNKEHVRPVRRTYKHLKCGRTTTMGTSIAETYARDPGYYGRTFCCACRDYFPVGADGEFVWEGTEEKVGT